MRRTTGPTIYNRLWHLDADDRRHHGQRKWEPAALDRLLDLANAVENCYPPNFSDRDVVRLSACDIGCIAELRTDDPRQLLVSIRVAVEGQLPSWLQKLDRSGQTWGQFALKTTRQIEDAKGDIQSLLCRAASG